MFDKAKPVVLDINRIFNESKKKDILKKNSMIWKGCHFCFLVFLVAALVLLFLLSVFVEVLC